MLLLLNYLYSNLKHKLQLQDASKKIHSYSYKAPSFIKPLKTIVWSLDEAAQLANTTKKSENPQQAVPRISNTFCCLLLFIPLFPILSSFLRDFSVTNNSKVNHKLYLPLSSLAAIIISSAVSKAGQPCFTHCFTARHGTRSMNDGFNFADEKHGSTTFLKP